MKIPRCLPRVARRRHPRPAGIGLVVLVVLVVVAWVSAAPAHAEAHAEAVPLESQAEILLRALAYDTALLTRVGRTFSVAVVYDPKVPGGLAAAQKTFAAFRRLEGVTVQGLQLTVTLVPYQGKAALLDGIRQHGIDTIYLQPELNAHLADVIDASHTASVVTMASEKRQVEGGAAIGVFLINGRSKLLINLAASKAEGAFFQAALLKVAQLVQ